MPGYWLIKSEPSVYPWTQLLKDERTVWDGIRSFEARNNLRAMKLGDLCLFYHSNIGKEVVGVAKVVRAAYEDPKAEGEDWSAIDVAAAYPFATPVTLSTLKETKSTSGMELVKKSRLSVTKVTAAEWKAVHALGKTKVPEKAQAQKKQKSKE